MEKMTFFGRNGQFVGVWKENKHGDPQFFFHFLMDNDNIISTGSLTAVKLFLPCEIKSKSGKNDDFGGG